MQAHFLFRWSQLFAIANGDPSPYQPLSEIDTFQDRIQWAEKHLKHLSSGSSRVVYLTPDHTILKVAKNNRGLAQNKAEGHPSVKSQYLNQILSTEPHHYWIETRYLEKITPSQFEEMTQLNFKQFGEAIRYALKTVSGNSDKKKPAHFDQIADNSFFQQIRHLGKQLDLMPGDLARISSWGENQGHPVLLDAGLTRTIFDQFYQSGEGDSSLSSS